MTSETEVRAHGPYGPLGLVLSLVFVSVLAAFYALVLAGALALGELLLFGRDRLAPIIQMFWASDSQRDTPSLLLAYWIGTLVYVLISAAVFTLARFRGGADWRRLVALEPRGRWWRSRAYWALVFAAIVYGVVASAAIGKFYPPSKDWFTLEPGVPMLATAFVLVVAVGPFAEELLFRGWIYTSLRARSGTVWSVAISAFLFALAHYDASHLYSLAVFPLGLILGTIRERSGTIWATIAVHALYNFSGWCAAALGAG